MPPFNKPVIAIAGIVCLIAGLVMVLAWWPDVVILFKGGGGIVLAITGMVLLASIKDNQVSQQIKAGLDDAKEGRLVKPREDFSKYTD